MQSHLQPEVGVEVELSLAISPELNSPSDFQIEQALVWLVLHIRGFNDCIPLPTRAKYFCQFVVLIRVKKRNTTF